MNNLIVFSILEADSLRVNTGLPLMDRSSPTLAPRRCLLAFLACLSIFDLLGNFIEMTLTQKRRIEKVVYLERSS